jgi:hypothetical protein
MIVTATCLSGRKRLLPQSRCSPLFLSGVPLLRQIAKSSAMIFYTKSLHYLNSAFPQLFSYHSIFSPLSLGNNALASSKISCSLKTSLNCFGSRETKFAALGRRNDNVPPVREDDFAVQGGMFRSAQNHIESCPRCLVRIIHPTQVAAGPIHQRSVDKVCGVDGDICVMGTVMTTIL